MDVENEKEIESSQFSEGKHACEHLNDYALYGWKPDPKLSDDNNYMDMVMLVTRSSHCKQGGMACVLVQPDASRNNIYDSIIGVSTNLPLYSENDSDVHAEVAALGKASRKGRATEKATAYITMPPCKKCFAALMVSGISRIVTRVTVPKQIEQAATKNGIEVVTLEGVEQQRERINIIIHGNPEGKRSLEDKEEIEERRKRRKEERQQRKNKNNETPT